MSKILRIIGIIGIIIGFVLFITPAAIFNDKTWIVISTPVGFGIFVIGFILIVVANSIAYKKSKNNTLNDSKNMIETFSDMIITSKQKFEKHCPYCGTKLQNSDNDKCPSCGAIYKNDKNNEN